MASGTLQAPTLPANPGVEIHGLATDGQTRSSRIRSLVDVIRTAADDTCSEADYERRRSTLNRVINFADMIEREREEASADGFRALARPLPQAEIGAFRNGN